MEVFTPGAGILLKDLSGTLVCAHREIACEALPASRLSVISLVIDYSVP